MTTLPATQIKRATLRRSVGLLIRSADTGGVSIAPTHLVRALPNPNKPVAVNQKQSLLSPALYDAKYFPSGENEQADTADLWAGTICGLDWARSSYMAKFPVTVPTAIRLDDEQ